MPHLFLCSVGPVQEFIATARRSRDLQYGSWMLSELAKAGAQALAQQYGVDNLIFPAPEAMESLAPGSPLNIVNKIFVVIDGEPASAGEVFRTAVNTRLKELREQAFSHIHNANFKRDLAIKQVADVPELYWVSVPYKPDEYPKARSIDEYPKARSIAEALLAARKNTRDFRQFPGATVPKSSLDASRESVIHENAYPTAGDDKITTAQKVVRLYLDYGARRGERLSGVDLLKRQGSRGIPFPSTSTLAALPFRTGRPPTTWDEIIKHLRTWLQEHHRDFKQEDSDLLYLGRVSEWLLDDEARLYGEHLEATLQELAKGNQPGAYYALLAADGDWMGKTLKNMKEPADHREFSKSLSAFAGHAKTIIRRHQGTPIYVGGDDIMAYLPLHTALTCLKELEAAFTISTLSGGLVIAHHLQPLSEVLQLARAAEKEAKSVPGKHALCVVLNKRSGAERTIKDKWIRLNARLRELVKFYRHEVISNGTAYELQKMARTLEGAGLPPEALEKEALRIIKRKKEAGGEADLPESVRMQLETWLSKEKHPVDELASEMIVASEFAAAETLADLPLAPLDNHPKEATP